MLFGPRVTRALQAVGKRTPCTAAHRVAGHGAQHTAYTVLCHVVATWLWFALNRPPGGLLGVVAVLCSQPCLVFSCTARMRACLVPVAVLRCSLFVALLLFLYCVRMCRM